MCGFEIGQLNLPPTGAPKAPAEKLIESVFRIDFIRIYLRRTHSGSGPRRHEISFFVIFPKIPEDF